MARFGLFQALTLLISTAAALLPSASMACTSFSLNTPDAALSCKRFDYYDNAGLVVVNPAGVSRSAIVHPAFAGHPKTWVSKYGSLTFTGFGAGFPGGGVNLKGLSVESLRNTNSVFPPEKDNGLPYINNRQWVQLLLDQAANVDEAVALAREVRVQDVFAHTHLYLSDPSGNSAVLDYLDGKLVITSGAALRVRAITNDPWFMSSAKLDHPISQVPEEDTRYERVALALKSEVPHANLVDWALGLLDQVPLGPQYVSWRIMYDVTHLEDIQVFFNSTQNPNYKFFHLKGFDFAKGAKAQIIDIQDPTLGQPEAKVDVSKRFKSYDYAADKKVVDGSSVVQIGEAKYPGTRELMLQEIRRTYLK